MTSLDFVKIPNPLSAKVENIVREYSVQLMPLMPKCSGCCAIIWEFANRQKTISRAARSHVSVMIPAHDLPMTFCANTDIALLAVADRDGVLAVFDHDLRLVEKRADTKVPPISEWPDLGC